MEQVSVERWLEQQTTHSDIEQYATDTWYVHSLPSLLLTYILSFRTSTYGHPACVFALKLG